MKANFDGTKGEKTKCKNQKKEKAQKEVGFRDSKSIFVLWHFLALGLISSQTGSGDLHLPGYPSGKYLCVLSTGKTTGQTLLLIFPGSAFLLCAVSKSRNR